MKVRFCDNNKGKGKVLRRLEEEHLGMDARVEKCLGICGPCAEQPVALVGGKKVKGKDGDDLYRRIVAALREKNNEVEAEKQGYERDATDLKEVNSGDRLSPDVL
jgi:uncharacterized protein YuzB (UPF0349 family)